MTGRANCGEKRRGLQASRAVARAATITIFGSSRPQPGQAAYRQAYELGAAIGRRGWVVVNGGYGGTMAASAAGAKSAGAVTIGVTCAAFGRGGANRYIDREINMPDLPSRLGRLIELGDGYVVLPGGTGTLVELSTVWEMLNKGLVRGRPLVLLGRFWQPVLECVGADDPAAGRLIDVAGTPAEAVESLAAVLEGRGR